jgi:hypothetical protein
MAYGFIPVLGWGIFWISLIVAVILFSISKRLYNVFYLVSVSLYVFTAGFIIDIYEFGELGVLVVLVISALVFMGLGFYLSQVLKHEK